MSLPLEAALAAIQPLSFTERQQLLQILTQENLVETPANLPSDLQRLNRQFWQGVSVQDIIESIEELSNEDQELLFELIHKRRIELRRAEIAANAEEVLQAVEAGTAKGGSFREMKAYLLSDEDE